MGVRFPAVGVGVDRSEAQGRRARAAWVGDVRGSSRRLHRSTGGHIQTCVHVPSPCPATREGRRARTPQGHEPTQAPNCAKAVLQGKEGAEEQRTGLRRGRHQGSCHAEEPPATSLPLGLFREMRERSQPPRMGPLTQRSRSSRSGSESTVSVDTEMSTDAST